jgi:quinol monooxygenase YgiN
VQQITEADYATKPQLLIRCTTAGTENALLGTKKKNFGVIARIRGLPEKADELRERLLELVRLTRNENGCLACEMVENCCDSTEFTLLEEWSQEKDHDAHFSTDLIQNAFKFYPDLLSTELDPRKHVLQSDSIRYGTNCYCLAVGQRGTEPGLEG